MNHSPRCGTAACGAVLAAFLVGAATAQERPAPPAAKGAKSGGVFVLDNCDPIYMGKAKYADNLTYIDATGKVAFRITGLNSCESIGSNHMVAVDGTRLDLGDGERREPRPQVRPQRQGTSWRIDVKGSALAVDPESGHLWVLTSTAQR